MQYSLDQYTLIPTNISEINHRDLINIYDQNKKFPIFVSPMTCILDSNNFDAFLNSPFIPIYPVRAETSLEDRLEYSAKNDCWVAVTLNEFIHAFCGCTAPEGRHYKVLIDCANGHMEEIYTSVADARQEYGENFEVMVGNIANPKTYQECCKSGIDYVRIGIGGGSGCTTSVQTGFHTSLGWLLEEIKQIKSDNCCFWNSDSMKKVQKQNSLFRKTKIVADGGVNTFSKAVKCLALGADYVMMGKCFAQCEEACGKYKEDRSLLVEDTDNQNKTVDMLIYKEPRYKVNKLRHYYGQASKQGQIDRFGDFKGKFEGTDVWVPVEYSLASFANKFEEVFKSALSYAGAFNFDDFIGKVAFDKISESEFYSFNKEDKQWQL